MRTICLFSDAPDSTYSLNIFSQLARKGKKVLIVDLRFGKKQENKHTVGLDIFSLFSQSQDVDSYIISLEPGLDVIRGNRDLNVQEFYLFPQLFKMDFIEKTFSHLNYDYIIYEVSPQLNLLNTNTLFASSELMCLASMDNNGLDMVHKFSDFVCEFNNLYGRKIVLTKIIPLFPKQANKEIYTHLISEFSSSIVSYPLTKQKNKEFGEALEQIASSIKKDGKYFDSKASELKKQEIVEKYFEILYRNNRERKKLDKFT